MEYARFLFTASRGTSDWDEILCCLGAGGGGGGRLVVAVENAGDEDEGGTGQKWQPWLQVAQQQPGHQPRQQDWQRGREPLQIDEG